jgi:hypothetical protein
VGERGELAFLGVGADAMAWRDEDEDASERVRVWRRRTRGSAEWWEPVERPREVLGRRGRAGAGARGRVAISFGLRRCLNASCCFVIANR